MSKSLTNEDMVRHYRREVDQLRLEVALPRVKVSDCMKSLMNYTQQHKDDDFLVSGISAVENPFQEKKKCIVL